ncbi:hypothetical protein JQ561_24235 [Bradyrhizobium diazoefficiens]|uniref:hypothetical protein n=1 Tax=unclassified Bradyrhizobium TaxID=2631580 RepID=UPI0018871F53|nr:MULTISPECIES: hypothetical protein [Bradyrhizobium]MBR0929725.1 hypothetical protein [Bradyrhizobium diazoefficiens]MDT4741871.1 hypothetical protein [Bradyrhizobium sp. WYCCWR 12699]
MAVAQLLEALTRKGRRQRSLAGARFGTLRRLRFDVGVIFAGFQFHRSGLSKLLQDNIGAAGMFLVRWGDDAA